MDDLDPSIRDLLRHGAAPWGLAGFRRQVVATGGCRRPIRLRTRPAADDPARVDTRRMPDGVLLKACGARRETVCPPCSALYRGDAFQLVAAGARGGKGIPDTVSGHPMVFVTLTAPSFGPVHRRRPDGTCHPAGRRCAHDQPLICARRHQADDPALGQALCPGCYRYDHAVLFNAAISELWRRTTIYTIRTAGHLAGMTARQAADRLRLSYVKVAELQQRGSVHLHALIRLDAKTDQVQPAPIDAPTLAAAIRIAAGRVTTPVHHTAQTFRFGWGRQLDIAVITDSGDGRRRAAAYLAKYSTKSVTDHGQLDHRLRSGLPDALDLPHHLRRLVTTAWHLGSRSDDPLRLQACAHTLGYRGHFLTKSRRYSTTFTALRDARQRWQTTQRPTPGAHPAADDQTDGDPEPPIQWEVVGFGYTTTGDAHYAETIADELRQARHETHLARMLGEDADCVLAEVGW